MQVSLVRSLQILGLTACAFFATCQTPPPPAHTTPNANSTATPTATVNNKRKNPVTDPTGANRSSWSLLDGRRTRLADYKGKVVVLDFWATYCPPCVAEASHLAALQRRFQKQGLNVVGLNVGGADDQPKIPDFVQQTKVQYEIGFPDGSLVESLMGTDDTIPQTFVFDREGKLVKGFVGYSPEIGLDIERTIETTVGPGK
ncbi:MAG: TlpA disulfide reductase family protein [Pyrinomonadaceae bacterium]